MRPKRTASRIRKERNKRNVKKREEKKERQKNIAQNRNLDKTDSRMSK